ATAYKEMYFNFSPSTTLLLMNTQPNQDFSLVSPESSERFIARINTLTPRSQALWGKMNVTNQTLHQ
ncbi:MAG: hypothetical protein ACIWVG_11410, partial [Gloeotrichia echinulata HAB0833]